MTQIPIMKQVRFYLSLVRRFVLPLSVPDPSQFWPNSWLSICHGYQPRSRDRSSILKLESLNVLIIIE